MPDTSERAMRPMTIRLDPDAALYLRVLCPGRTGQGALISRLLMEHKVRRELTEKHRSIATKEQWDESGIRVE